MKIPSRRKELSKILKDGIDESEKRLELKRFKDKCFNCGAEESLELDHHLPLSRGYPLKCKEVGSNTVVLCERCNRRKGDKLPDDFYTREKLEQLEDMGIRSHLYYSPARIIELENLMIGEKIRRLEKAIDKKHRLSFSYYDMSEILFLEEEVTIVPVKVYNRNVMRINGVKKEWYLEDNCNKLYNIRWIFNIKTDGWEK